MKRGMTGTYEILKTGKETVKAFIPAPLPPEPPLALLRHQHLLERATLALGRLDSVALLLPEPDIFLYAYVRREAVYSSQIEGTQSSLSDLLLFELEGLSGALFDDVEEVSNYVGALNHGVRRLKEGFPLCNRLLREMHEILLRSGRGEHKSPGQFRRSQNWIGGTRPGNAYFVPPPPQYVEQCMADLERFLNEDSSYPVLVKAALAHVQFESIHPFLDGNGRLGRLLIAFILHHEQLLSRPLLYLSLYFKQHKARYYELLNRVREQGEWEDWVVFFLEGVQRTAEDAVQMAGSLIELFEEDRKRIRAEKYGSSSLLHIFNAFCKRPVGVASELVKSTGLSFPTVSKGIKKLCDLGILREEGARKRNKIFTYQRYISILNEE